MSDIDARLDEIQARADAATAGPWCTDSWEIYQGTEYQPGLSMWIGETCRGETTCEQDRADAAFVAAARQDVPDLLAEVNRLRARVTELETAQTAFLLPWAHQLDAKSLDNFVGDLARAADAPLMFVVDEIHQTVAAWRELVAGKSAEQAGAPV